MQEGEYDGASVASLPAQSPRGQSAGQGPGRGAAVAARVPIQEEEDDGEAHRRWPDGSEYFGEWHGGQPNGRGIFVWPAGEGDLSVEPVLALSDCTLSACKAPVHCSTSAALEASNGRISKIRLIQHIAQPGGMCSCLPEDIEAFFG